MNKKLGKLRLQNYQPLRDVVFEYLRSAILNGDLKPKERLMEVQLAEQLGVSRTPIREAIRKLELEGLVVMIPRRGAYVGDISVKDILDVLEVREVLEGLAAFLAAERMQEDELESLRQVTKEFWKVFEERNTQGMVEKDNEFHDKIFQSTRNAKLIHIAHGLHEQVQRFRIMYFSEYNTSKTLAAEHQAILEAIAKRDGQKARELAQYHVRMLRDAIKDFEDEE